MRFIGNLQKIMMNIARKEAARKAAASSAYLTLHLVDLDAGCL